MPPKTWQKMLFLLAIFLQPGMAYADWRSEIGVFRIGIFTGEQTQGVIARSEPFRLAIQEALGMEVEFFPSRRTENLIDALRTDRIEYAILSASAYALAWNLCECVEPVAIPRSTDSTDGYHTIVIAERDGVSSLKELEGQRLAELSPQTFSQSMVLKMAMRDEGVDAAKVEFVSADSGEEALAAFLNGEYAALIGWSSLTGLAGEGYSRGTLSRIASQAPEALGSYRVIWKSQQIPHRPHVVRKRLASEAKEILRTTLQSMFDRNPVAYDSIEPQHGGGFGSARHARFELLVDAMKEIIPTDRGTVSSVEAPDTPEKENPPD